MMEVGERGGREGERGGGKREREGEKGGKRERERENSNYRLYFNITYSHTPFFSIAHPSV